MEKFGVRNIYQVSSPYRPIEITKNLDANTALCIAVGSKDSDRIQKLIRNKTNSDGSYFRHYNPEQSMQTYRVAGYIYLVPDVKLTWRNQNIDGTLLRKILPDLPKLEFEGIMGWYDSSLQNLFRDKFTIQRSTIKEAIEEIYSDQASKHLRHPWECLDLTYNDLVQLIVDSLSARLENVTEKIDGQNLLVTVINGEVRFARNKTEIKNPLTRIRLSDKFSSLPPNVKSTFDSAALFLENSIKSSAINLFDNGEFLNVEIVHPDNVNVIQYSPYPYIILHSLIRYDQNGNEVSRNISKTISLYDLLQVKSVKGSYSILPPRKLVFNPVYNSARKIAEYKSELDTIWKKHGLLPGNTIEDFFQKCAASEPRKLRKDVMIVKYRYPLEILFSKIAYTILSEIEHGLCKSPYSAISIIRKEIAKVSTDVHNEGDPLKIRTLQTELGKLNAIGGLDTILAIEGIVFTFKGRLMKYTGSFRFINQILGINRYSR
jgi:hypothetical protein